MRLPPWAVFLRLFGADHAFRFRNPGVAELGGAEERKQTPGSERASALAVLIHDFEGAPPESGTSGGRAARQS
jgi:hypothetical protein